MRKAYLIILAVIALSFACGVYLYPQMPAEMASHWNAQGEVDGYMSKFWGLFLLPLITSAMFLLLVFLPRIDPMKQNVEKFRSYFDNFMVLLVLFFLYLHTITILWNFDIVLDINVSIAPAIAILLYYAGVMLEKARRNWFIGIRTPWTLSSEKVWDKTHQLGGKLFKLCAMFALTGVFLRDYLVWLIMVPILSTSLFLLVYSYFAWKQEKQKVE